LRTVGDYVSPNSFFGTLSEAPMEQMPPSIPVTGGFRSMRSRLPPNQ
jgi:hypothetical protein